MVVPVYEREQAGVYYNTAAVFDADGTLPRQVPQEPHPAHDRLLGEVLLQARQPRLSRLPDALREDRRLHLLRPPLPRGRAAARPERRRDRLQPVGHGRRALAVPLEARAARARGRERLLHGVHQPRRHRGAVEHRQVLRLVLLRRSARQLPRRRVRGQGRAGHRGDGPRHDRGGAAHLAVLPRPPARDLRRRWRSCCRDPPRQERRHRHGHRPIQGRHLRRGRDDLDDRDVAVDARRSRHRRGRQARVPRRHRRAHAPRHAVRRDDVGRRFRVGHDRRGARRHDDDRRLRHPVPRPDAASGVGDVDARRPRARRRSTTAST